MNKTYMEMILEVLFAKWARRVMVYARTMPLLSFNLCLHTTTTDY